MRYEDEEVTRGMIEELGEELPPRLSFFRCVVPCYVLNDLLCRLYDSPRIENFGFGFPFAAYGETTEELEEVFNGVFLCDNDASYRSSLRSLHLGGGVGELDLRNRDPQLLPNLETFVLEGCDRVDPITARGLTCSVREVALTCQPDADETRSLLQNCCGSPRLTSLRLARVNLSATSADDYLPFLLGGGIELTVSYCSLRLEDLQVLMKLVGTRSMLGKFRVEESRMPLGYRPLLMEWCIRRTDSVKELRVGGEDLTGFVRSARERREKLVKRVIEEWFECDELVNMVRVFLF